MALCLAKHDFWNGKLHQAESHDFYLVYMSPSPFSVTAIFSDQH